MYVTRIEDLIAHLQTIAEDHPGIEMLIVDGGRWDEIQTVQTGLDNRDLIVGLICSGGRAPAAGHPNDWNTLGYLKGDSITAGEARDMEVGTKLWLVELNKGEPWVRNQKTPSELHRIMTVKSVNCPARAIGKIVLEGDKDMVLVGDKDQETVAIPVNRLSHPNDHVTHLSINKQEIFDAEIDPLHPPKDAAVAKR